MISEDITPPALILRWQGLIQSTDQQRKRFEVLAGLLLALLFATLPLVSRIGLGLAILAAGSLWVLWALVTPAGPIRNLSLCLLIFLSIAVLATGFSPVPQAASKGLIKLISYLGVFALIRQLLASQSIWWDRIVAAILAGELAASVLALRQLYGSAEELANWADPNSVAEGTIRIYGPLGNPNLLAGYLIPILPLALAALLRWKSLGAKAYAGVALGLGCLATLYTYSRGGWLGMIASLGVMVLLVALRATRHWPLFWRRVLPLGLILISTALLCIAVTQIEPIRTRVLSLVAGRGDSSNNFRINVWLAALDMIRDRPWLGIGPGNAAFNSIYPLYQQPRFNALSAYSVPLEILVETGIPGLMACIALLMTCIKRGWTALGVNSYLAIPCLASLASIAGLLTQGITDTIFFRPEVQLVGWFCVATLSQPITPSEASNAA